MLGRPGQLLAEDGAHARSEEAEIGYRDRHAVPADRHPPGHERFILAAAGDGLRDLVVVRAGGFREAERIGGADPLVPFLKRIRISQHLDPLARAHPVQVTAFRAHPQVVLELRLIDQLIALRALDPQVAEVVGDGFRALVVRLEWLEFTTAVEERTHRVTLPGELPPAPAGPA